MTVLLDDNFARGAAPPPRERKSRLTGGLLLIFLFLSAALMVLSRLDHELVRKTRTSVTELLVPMVNHASTPANGFHRVRGQLTSYFDLFVELERLKQENQRLRQWESRAMHLEYQVAEYRQLLNGVKDFNRGFVTGRMIADGRGPFMRSALVNIGRDNGVSSGSACRLTSKACVCCGRWVMVCMAIVANHRNLGVMFSSMRRAFLLNCVRLSTVCVSSTSTSG